MRDSFVMYTSYYQHIQRLSMERRGQLFTAIMEYASGNDLPEMDEVVEMAFSFIKDQMDRDSEKYQKIVKKRSDAGKLGGRPKGNVNPEKQSKAKKANGFSEKQSKAKKPDNVYVYDDVNVNKKNTMCNADANALFERLWKAYPSKRGKGQVSEAKKCKLAEIGEEHMLRAMTRYIEDLKQDDWRKPQNGSTFFNSGYVDYLDDNYVPPEKKSSSEKPNKFRNFAERDNDYADLQAQLLRKGME